MRTSVQARRARLTVLAGIVLLAATGSVAETRPASADRVPASKRTQQLVVLFTPHWALARPAKGAPRLRKVQARRPITETRTVLPVLRHSKSRDGTRWLLVRLPGRPNGQAGWINRRATTLARTSWRLLVHTDSRTVSAYRYGRGIRVFKAVVGKPSTPTPPGQFFVEESIRLSTSAVGAPFALALSARSTVFQEFAGGPGQIALHGLRNVGGTPGTAVSHGCVRLDTPAMRWLVRRIGPGAPVTIER